MAYTKLTVPDFKKRLKEGQYASATGARRGVGKASDMSAEDKAKCYKSIDKHFGETSTPPAKKKAAKGAAQPTKKKVAAHGTKKKAAKKAAKSAEASEAPTEQVEAQDKTSKPGKTAASKGRGRRGAAQPADVDSATMAKLHLAKERIGTINQAVETMKRAKEAYPDLDTSAGAEAAGKALTEIMEDLHATVKKGEQLELPEVDPRVVETLAKTAPGAQGLPGQASPVQVPHQRATPANGAAPEPVLPYSPPADDEPVAAPAPVS